jgi:hypothetical protein
MTFCLEEAYRLYDKAIQEDELEQGNMKDTIINPVQYIKDKKNIKKTWKKSFKEMQKLPINLDNDFVRYMNYLSSF